MQDIQRIGHTDLPDARRCMCLRWKYTTALTNFRQPRHRRVPSHLMNNRDSRMGGVPDRNMRPTVSMLPEKIYFSIPDKDIFIICQAKLHKHRHCCG